MYRFDSSDEARMAYLLDKDSSVEDWLRPAPNQFEGLYWRDEAGNSQHRYEPDFVVEFKNEIVMIEVKPSIEINIPDVQEKKKTADKYCELVSKNIGSFGIVKPWRYVIIATEKITASSTIAGLLAGQGDLNNFIIGKSDLFFSDVIPNEEKYINYLPVLSVEAIATHFGEEALTDEIIGWWRNTTGSKVSKDMYVMRVKGRSMESTIKDGDYCIFHRDRGGTREGKVVVVALRNVSDPETMARYTIKRYHSEKNTEEGLPLQKRIVLSPDNPDFKDMILGNAQESDYQVVGIFVSVIK